jgi:hypothetical protein
VGENAFAGVEDPEGIWGGSAVSFCEPVGEVGEGPGRWVFGERGSGGSVGGRGRGWEGLGEEGKEL